MEDEQLYLASSIIIAVAAVVILRRAKKRQISKRKRSVWIKSWLSRRSEGKGMLNLLNRELKTEDAAAYKNYLRMDYSTFSLLLGMVESKIKKENTLMRDAISASNRLEITFRYLATGESFRSLMFTMRVHETTISKFIPEACQAIFDALKDKYLKTPTSEEEWLQIVQAFETKWQFPNCIGTLDGRHITFRAPTSSGSYYYNYKGNNRLVLLALVDANYRFLYANVGINGSVSNGGVFEASQLSFALINDKLTLPKPRLLPGGTKKVPFVIVADDAFPLMENVMKPYPMRGLCHDTRIFNSRLSRARRMVESTFGILANRFRVLLSEIPLKPEKVQIITLACIALHNYLSERNMTDYTDMTKMENEACSTTIPKLTTRQGSNRSANKPRVIRDEFQKYFNSPQGAVPWQEDAIKYHNW